MRRPIANFIAYLVLALGADSVSAATAAAPGAADLARSFNIPSQQLESALKQFALQSDREILFAPQDAAAKRTSGVHGDYVATEALGILLEGTGLNYRVTSGASIVVERVTTRSEVPVGVAGEPMRFAQADNVAQAPPSVSDASGEKAAPTGLEEVIVTAQKHEERLQDVPVPVAVVNTDLLQETNQTSLQNYYNTIPGFTIGEEGAQGYELLVIRGITTGNGSDPTVGVTVDDAPFGASLNVAGGNQLPQIDPDDLQRIEVLRGPQGTLYGANSMGGLIRFVTKEPTTDKLYGSVTAGTSAIHNGAEPGYNFRASANVPLSDSLAARVSAYSRQDPGYVDNPFLNIKGINEAHAAGGRVSLKWSASDSVSLKLNALYQRTKSDGSSDVSIGLGDLQQNMPPGIGGLTNSSQFYSMILESKLGAVDFTSVTGYSILTHQGSFDYTPGFAPLFESPAPWYPCFVDESSRNFSQELRFSGSFGARIDWRAGVFYAYQKGSNLGIFDSADTSGAITGTVFQYLLPTLYREGAGFFDLSYAFTDRFDVQVGGRYSHLSTYMPEYSGPPIGYTPADSAPNNVFNYMASPRWRISPDLMVYGRIATGYRAGASNGSFPNFAHAYVPDVYNADKTKNYEVGLKGDFLDHKLSVDASIYYIEWNNIQLTVNDPSQFSYNINAGDVKSEGVELAASVTPVSGLNISGWVTYDDAALTKDVPAGTGYAFAGNPLPFTSRWSAYLSIQDEFPLIGAVRGFVGGQISWVGGRLGNIPPCSTLDVSPCPSPAHPRQEYPAYAQTNLRAGAKYGPWTGTLFVNNVADRRGLIGGGSDEFPPNAYEYIQPRAVGVNITRTF